MTLPPHLEAGLQAARDCATDVKIVRAAICEYRNARWQWQQELTARPSRYARDGLAMAEQMLARAHKAEADLTTRMTQLLPLIEQAQAKLATEAM